MKHVLQIILAGTLMAVSSIALAVMQTTSMQNQQQAANQADLQTQAAQAGLPAQNIQPNNYAGTTTDPNLQPNNNLGTTAAPTLPDQNIPSNNNLGTVPNNNIQLGNSTTNTTSGTPSSSASGY